MLAVDHSHDDMPMARLLRAIDNENVAVEKARVHHGVARQPYIEGRGRMRIRSSFRSSSPSR